MPAIIRTMSKELNCAAAENSFINMIPGRETAAAPNASSKHQLHHVPEVEMAALSRRGQCEVVT